MSSAKDSLKSSAFMEIVEVISEGEIRGWANATPEESLFFDGTAIVENGINNFDGVEIQSNKGTQDQTYIRQKLDEGSISTAAYGQLVTNQSGPVTKSTSGVPNADKARITIKLPGGIYHTQSDGDVKRNRLSLRFDIKASNSATFIRLDLNGRDSFNDKTLTSYERSYQIDLLKYGIGPYDIRMTKLSPDQAGNNVNTVVWESMSLIVSDKLRYPNSAIVKTLYDAKNITRIPNRGFEIYGLICKIPDVYDPITRTYSGPWLGGMKDGWTDNPAWIYYDMITKPRYGLGELLDINAVNKTVLFSIGQYCDELIDRGDGVLEPRFTCSVYLQRAADAYKVITDLASVFRGMIYYTNGEVYTVQDSPGNSVAQYAPANVIDGMFNYTSTPHAARYSVALMAWNDPADGFRRVIEYVENPSALARYGLITKDATAIGTLSRSQAHRAGKYLLLSSQLETEAVNFKVGIGAMFSMPGDIIRVYDPTKSTTAINGGRIQTAGVSSVVLDREVTLNPGSIYTLSLTQSDGDLVDVTVNSPAGTYAAGDSLTFSPLIGSLVIPIDESVWILLEDTTEWKLYRTLGITEEKTQDSAYFSITASFHDPDKYALIDNIDDLAAMPDTGVDVSAIRPVSAISITEGVVAKSFGIDRYLDISWQQSPGPYLDKYKIEIEGPNGFEVTFQDTTFMHLGNVGPGTYTVTIFAVDISGKLSTGLASSTVLDDIPPIELIKITGLELEGQGIDLEFAGKDPVFSWRVTSLVNEEVGSESASGTADADPWLESYEINIYNPDGTLRRTDFSNIPKYVYTFESNTLDGGVDKAARQFTFSVAARDRYGRLGEYSSISVQNLPPTSYRELSISSGYESIFISYLPPDDIDYVKTRVYLSDTSGFTPDNVNLTNLAYEGVDVLIQLPGLIGSTYYLRLEGVDEFGPAGVFSSEFTGATSTSSSLAYNLREKITESFLYKGLLERIDKIDGNGLGSVNQRISISTGGTASDILALQVQTSDLFAAVQVEETARIGADDTISAESTIKLDVNGHVAGMGLLVSGGTSGPISSEVVFLADKFSVTLPTIEFTTGLALSIGQFVRPSDAYIASNGNPGLAYRALTVGSTAAEPTWPTVAGDVTTSGTVQFIAVSYAQLVPFTVGPVNGVPTVVMDAAFIADASIANAMIGSLSASKLTAGTIIAGLIELGNNTFTLDATNKILTVKDQQASPVTRVRLGQLDGTAEGFGLEVYDASGTLILGPTGSVPAGLKAFAYIDKLDPAVVNIATYLAAGVITNAYIGDTIQSANYTGAPGVGWRIDKTGKIEVSDILIMDSGGNVILATGPAGDVLGNGIDNAAQQWGDIAGAGKPQDNADVTGNNTALNVVGQTALATLPKVTGVYIDDLSVDTLHVKDGAISADAAAFVSTRAVFSASPGNAGNWANGVWRTLLTVQVDAGIPGYTVGAFSITSGTFDLEFLTSAGSNTGYFSVQARIVKLTDAADASAGSIVDAYEYSSSLVYTGTTSSGGNNLAGVDTVKNFRVTMQNGNRTYLVNFPGLQIAEPNSLSGIVTYYLQVRGYGFSGGNLTLTNVYKRPGTNLSISGAKK